MSTAFLRSDIWPQITRAARGSRGKGVVAVAYFGKGASRLLPLAGGSCLVVDASERSVAAGLTCPTDLLKLANRGVAIYSVPNLHAKVFVLGEVAFIGSANASGRSASYLIEAVVRTGEKRAVQAARKFVRDLCLHELTPGLLRRLGKLYRPPKIPGGKRRVTGPKTAPGRPALPRVLLAQLELEEWSPQEQSLHDEAKAVAKKRMEHPRSYKLDSFRYTGQCPYKPGDVVIQVTDEGVGTPFATAPGTVLYVRTRQEGRRRVSFVYLERPNQYRRRVALLARTLGRGAKGILKRNGLVRNIDFAHALLQAWAR